MPPSMAASSQPALHMTAGFRIKARESGCRQRQAPSDETLSAAIGRRGRGFTVRSAFTLQILADVMFQGDALLTREGGRCIARGVADRSRRS